MALLIFARHGNTFDPGDKVVWVGRELDLPLVTKGLEQAEKVAGVLARQNFKPDRVYAASLQRTRRFADIVARSLGLPAPVIDPRLDELDYGAWGGRTNDEILAQDPDAAAALQAWNDADQWPSRGVWGSDQDSVMAEIRSFADDILRPAQGTALVVSSNGILRFLPRFLLRAEDQPASFKMRTGHLGAIVTDAQGAHLRCWDIAPDDLPHLV